VVRHEEDEWKDAEGYVDEVSQLQRHGESMWIECGILQENYGV
jgi:hypothetical protein